MDGGGVEGEDGSSQSLVGFNRLAYEPLNTLNILKSAANVVKDKGKQNQDAILRYRMYINDADLRDIRQTYEQRRLIQDVQKNSVFGDSEMLDVDDVQPDWVTEEEESGYPSGGFSPTDVKTLYKFIHQSGKIMPRYQTKLKSKQQRNLAKAVKAARQMGLIPTTYALPKHLQEQHVPEAMSARAPPMSRAEKKKKSRRRRREPTSQSVSNLSTQTKEDETRKSTRPDEKTVSKKVPDAKPRKTVEWKVNMPQWMADYMQLYYEKTGELESLAKEGQYRFAQGLARYRIRSNVPEWLQGAPSVFDPASHVNRFLMKEYDIALLEEKGEHWIVGPYGNATRGFQNNFADVVNNAIKVTRE